MEPITTLAASILLVLSKYALKESGKVVGEIGKEAILLSSELLKKVRTHFETQPDERPRKALANYVDDPEDYEAVFEKYLQQELKANEAFHQEVVSLLQRFQAAAPESEVNIAVSGSGAIATHGGVAAGEGGAAVKGNVEGGIHIGRSE